MNGVGELAELFEIAEKANKYGSIERHLSQEAIEELKKQAGVKVELRNDESDAVRDREMLHYSYGL